MVLGPYQGHLLVPGMGSPVYTAEHDLAGLIYGSPHLCTFVTHAVIDGSTEDTGNTGNVTVLRPGLVMAQHATTQKWHVFDNGGSNELNIARGILVQLGLNTQLDGSDTDRFLATILVGGIVNPEAVCIAASSTYGLAKTGAGLNVRKALMYSIRFSDDFMGLVPLVFGSR